MKGLFVRIAILGLLVTFAAGTLQAADCKTLKRTEDAVVVYGSQLKKTLNFDISRMSLMAAKNGRLEAVPFQIDEIDKDGEWVLTMVPPAMEGKLKPGEDEDNGKLDGNDQLAFMVRDAGDRVAAKDYPAGVKAVDEIRLSDPLDGGQAWVYLCVFDGRPPRSSVDYIKYDIANDRIISAVYDMGFPPDLPIAPGSISLKGSQDILDRFKIRVSAEVFGLTVKIDETRFISNLSLYKDGPIRVLRSTKNAIEVYKFLRTPSAAVENIYYCNSVSIPIRMAVPVNVVTWDRFVDLESVGAADFQNMKGWQIKTNIDQVWYKIDGSMDAAEKQIPAEGFEWFCVQGDPGAFMIRITMNKRPDGTRQVLPLKTRLYYKDDDSIVDQIAENVPGQSPQVGFYIDNIDKLKKGTMYFFASLYPMFNYRDGDEKKYITMTDHPLGVCVN